MLKKLMSNLGYITKEDAERAAADRAKEAVAQIEAIKPGDEFINASRCIRKRGFKIVYALGDGNAEKNAIRLAEDLSHPASPVDRNRMITQFLPNVKQVDNASLLN